MHEFYRKAALVFLGLVALTSVPAYIWVERFFVSDALFPAYESDLAWSLKTISDEWKGGSSSVSVTEETYSIDYEYLLTEAVRLPVITVLVAFSELSPDAKNLIDLSGYSTATFRVKCVPRNILTFHLYSFDEKVTDPVNFNSYRVATAVFSCDEEWSDVEIDLRHLKVPVWWLQMAKIDFSDQDYSLDKVLAIAFDASRQGPVSTPARVKIGELILHGRDWRHAWAFVGFLSVAWIGFISWFFWQYTLSLISDVTDRLKKDRPLIAYQQLSIESHRDKERGQVLRFMETKYTNPDMSLEFAVAELGINRTKINELLKNELGMTFSAYLNKLRLSTAADLFSQRDDANVADIAYSVGYKNVSYFSKLFKYEYGHTPRAFIDVHRTGKGG
jgi:AraC-like DNA-binding protein